MRLLLLSAAIATFGASVAEAADPKAAQLSYQPWVRICVNRPDGNSDCFTSSGARGACQPSGGGIAVWIRDGRQQSLSVNLVTKRALEGTLTVRVDQGASISVPDPNCTELGCRGRLDIDASFIETLKRAQTINVDATTRDHQIVALAFPLAGFADAFDGPPGATPKAAEMSSDESKEQLKRTANPPPCEE